MAGIGWKTEFEAGLDDKNQSKKEKESKGVCKRMDGKNILISRDFAEKCKALGATHSTP